MSYSLLFDFLIVMRMIIIKNCYIFIEGHLISDGERK